MEDAGIPRLLLLTLRRRERVVWCPVAWSVFQTYGSARRIKWRVRSLVVFTDKGDLPNVEKQASKRGSWWQLSYNLACYYARRTPPDPESALRWLETALERPGSEQMGAWLQKDPDLKTLQGHPRFEWVMSQISKSREVTGGG